MFNLTSCSSSALSPLFSPSPPSSSSPLLLVYQLLGDQISRRPPSHRVEGRGRSVSVLLMICVIPLFFFHFSHAVATAQFLCSPSLYLSPLRSIDSGGGFSIVAHGRESRVVGSALTSLPRQKKREQDERRGRDYGRVSRVVVLVVVVGYSLHSLEQMELLIVGGSMVAEGLKKKSRKHKHASC